MIYLKNHTHEWLMTRPSFKDAQLSIRISSEILEEFKQEAKKSNLSMADYFLKIYQERKNEDDIRARLNVLERYILHIEQAKP